MLQREKQDEIEGKGLSCPLFMPIATRSSLPDTQNYATPHWSAEACNNKTNGVYMGFCF